MKPWVTIQTCEVVTGDEILVRYHEPERKALYEKEEICL